MQDSTHGRGAGGAASPGTASDPVSGTAAAAAEAAGPPPRLPVRLSSNESPFGPSPAAVAALREAADGVHRYPDDQSSQLRSVIAGEVGLPGAGGEPGGGGVPPERVAVGTGSAGLLMDLVAHECRPPGGGPPGAVLTYERAFIVYRLAAGAVGAPYVEAPLGQGYRRDPEALLDRLDGDTRLLVIDNPANPTGRHLTGEELAALVEGVPEHVTVAVDEAYVHFALGQDGYASATELDLDHPRLLVLRSLSKAHALAGLRIGYLVGPPDLVASLDARRVRFNVNAAAQAAAVAALRDREHLRLTVEATLSGRARMAAGLRDLGVPVVEGLGNFLLVELGEPAGPVVEAYADRGVAVRPLAPYGLDSQIRVSVGTSGEIDAFLEASGEVLAGVAARR